MVHHIQGRPINKDQIVNWNRQFGSYTQNPVYVYRQFCLRY